MNFGEQLANNFQAFVDGISVFLVGITMVFIALAILILLITVVGKIVTSFENKKEATKPSILAPVVPVVAQEPVQAQEVSVDELELVAVITAAIAASMGTTTDKLRVRSLRQVTRQK